jgi:hypothetical protein
MMNNEQREMIEGLKAEGGRMTHAAMMDDPRMQALLKKDQEYSVCLRILQEHEDCLATGRAVLVAGGYAVDPRLLQLSQKVQAAMDEISMFADGLRWEIDRLLENTL